MGILAGMQDVVVGGGVESMSRWPVDENATAPATLDGDNPELREKYPTVPQGISADLIATRRGVQPRAVRRACRQSQERAAKALAEGRFDRSAASPVRNA